MIKSFDKATATAIGKEVEAAIEAIAAKHGLTFQRGNGKFSADSFRISNIEFGIKATTASSAADKGRTRVNAAAENAYNLYSRIHNLPPVGTVFTKNREKLRILGWDTKKQKYPIMLENVDTGKTYKAPIDFVKGVA